MPAVISEVLSATKQKVPSIAGTIRGILSQAREALPSQTIEMGPGLSPGEIARAKEIGRNKAIPTSVSTPSFPSTRTVADILPQSSPFPTPSAITARNPAVSNFSIDPVVAQALNTAAAKYGIPPELLFDIALQESSFDPQSDPYEQGRGEQYREAGYPKGLFQITDPTLEALRIYGKNPASTLELPNWERFDPLTNALMAAYLISRGQLGRWEASKGVWGPYYNQEELQPFYSQTPERR